MVELKETYSHLLTINISDTIKTLSKPLLMSEFITILLANIGLKKSDLTRSQFNNLRHRVYGVLRKLHADEKVLLKHCKTEIHTTYYLVTKLTA